MNSTHASAALRAFEVSFIAYESMSLTTEYLKIATAALVAWQYLITFEREVTFFWNRKPSGASALFFANRYLGLAFSVYNTWTPYGSSYTYVVWAAFSSLRAYALRKQWVLAAIVLLLSLAPVAINMASYAYWSLEVDPIAGCVSGVTLPTAALQSSELAVSSRVSPVLADIIVFLITWSVTYGYHNQDVVQVAGRAPTLTSALFKNSGFINFSAVLTILNALYLACSLLQITVKGPAANRANFFLNLISNTYFGVISLVITDFIFKLQEAASASSGSRLSTDVVLVRSSRADVSVLEFARADVDLWAREGRGTPDVADDVDINEEARERSDPEVVSKDAECFETPDGAR
ncbi:hypothetical protein C2E23DRAFT_905093 [Lenzites betulinus]|nr:hypothetical protein C2E23DRAFT_905093 [Lenzites betulinus]